MVGLREIRKKKKLNQQRVALDLNITREALSQIGRASCRERVSSPV